MKNQIYLDNAATTYPKPEQVYAALNYANRNLAFNAGRGNYPSAKRVFDMIVETKEKLGSLLGVSGSTVSFESSATESLNLIIQGLGLSEGDNVYISPFEHNAIVRPLFNLKKKNGIEIHMIPFDEITWQVKLDALHDDFVRFPPKAVFLSHISNVTGYVLPFESVFTEAKKFGAVTILDCAQSLGVLNPEIRNVDLLVFAGHKSLYATFGIAGFFDLTDIRLDVVKSGGTGSDSLNHDMPENGSGRYEAGSQNSVAIAGLNSSLDWLKENPPLEHERGLTEKLILELKKLPKVKLFLPEDTSNILGIVSLAVNGYTSSDVGTILSEDYGICVRTGFHCSPFVHDFIHSKPYGGTVRISLGAFTTDDDIINLVSAIRSL